MLCFLPRPLKVCVLTIAAGLKCGSAHLPCLASAAKGPAQRRRRAVAKQLSTPADDVHAQPRMRCGEKARHTVQNIRALLVSMRPYRSSGSDRPLSCGDSLDWHAIVADERAFINARLFGRNHHRHRRSTPPSLLFFFFSLPAFQPFVASSLPANRAGARAVLPTFSAINLPSYPPILSWIGSLAPHALLPSQGQGQG